MSRLRHEIPTHLNVEDKAFFGLSVRQVLFLVSGLAGSYAIWSQWPEWPVALRLALAAANFLFSAAFALIRPGRRGLEEWAFVALHYFAIPKASVWQAREPDPVDWLPAKSAWAEYAPQVAWVPVESETLEVPR